MSAARRRGGHETGRPTRLDAIVTDVQTRWGLAGVRALGRAGLRVMALGPQRSAAGTWSRHAAARAETPDPVKEPRAFAQCVGGFAERHGPVTVYPSGESAIDALADHAGELPPEALLPYADIRALDVLRDKRELPALAEAAGLTTPRTLMEATAAEIAAAPPEPPFVVKQVVAEGSLAKKTKVIERASELADLLAGVPPHESLLLQERAEGALTGLALVLDRDGRVVARFQQIARRLWPAQAGGSTLAVSVEPDDELTEKTARMLSSIGFWGLAQVQFLPTERGPALIDINPRFYGSMPLATDAGVNLPAIWHAVANGASVGEPPAYRVGMSYRWLEADLTAAFNGFPRRLVSRTPRPKTGAVWAPDDPVPSVIMAAEAVSARLRRRMARA